MTDLRVELYGRYIGDLVGTHPLTFDFRTSREAFAVFPLGSRILSESVPLDAIQNRGRAERRRNFFSELLPEGVLYQYLRDQAGLSAGDTIGMLSHYGRDVAGAIQIYDPAAPGEPRKPFATEVDEKMIAEMLRDERRYPLGNSRQTGKSLINGVQEKIVLVREGGQWKRPNDGYASTHILKPRLGPDSTTIFDEEYAARIARTLMLASHLTMIESFDGIDTLVVQRYDRSTASPDGRVHQEDMNQALGASGNQKHQNKGGKITLKRVADAFLKSGDTESAERLARMNTLAVAVGNLDMHGKNISLLHPFDDRPTLAPTYDVVPMAHLDNDHEMALAVNGKYLHASITAEDVVAEAQAWGLAKADEIVFGTLADIRDALVHNDPIEGSYQHLQDDLTKFTTNLLAGEAAGEAHVNADNTAR